jgi:hypothetical protein
MDTANTLMNWIEYTQYILRENGKVSVIDEEKETVQRIVKNPFPFIDRPWEHEYFQRKYGLDPEHRKDTRNLNNSQTITDFVISEHQVKKAFISLSLQQPIGGITSEVVDKIAYKTGIPDKQVEEILRKNYPHGSIGGFMTNYFEMAFKGREECRDFERATAEIFNNVFNFKAQHIAGGAKEVPDVLLVADDAGYQAIIDTKAYSRYDLNSTQRDRMIYHYIPDIYKYSSSTFPMGFFSYISGGFKSTIAVHLQKITEATSVNGSAMPVANFIKMAEIQAKKPYSQLDISSIFSVNRKVELHDIERG